MENKYVIGLDFGSDSVRSVLVDASNGATLGSKVHWYKRWKEGKYCDPEANRFRQHPLDHIEGMEFTISEVVKEAGIPADSVKGICIDTTGSSPIPVNEAGTALSLLPEFAENPNGMMVLWKDHTAIKEADEINELARSWGGEDFTKFEGGIYSSEWFWAKILHIAREDEAVKNAAHSWVEHCDLMTYMLIGEPELSSFKRSRCAAGHKAMWHESWGGLPADEFLTKLDPYLTKLKSNLFTETYTSDEVAGNLSQEWADKLGLTTDCVVAVGTFDAHSGAVGAEVEENTLVRVMGTSTCDIIVSSNDVIGTNCVAGICGQVDGSVIPGMVGLEAGQSAFGDVLAWFKNLISWPLDNLLTFNLSAEQIEEIKNDIIAELSKQAESTPVSESAPIALDWVNGRRTPDANQNLKAAIVNLSLGTTAPHIFRALVEAICFGSKKIVDRFQSEGVTINSVVGIGGVAKKSGFIMQTLANVLNMPIKVAVSEQAPALGAAMYAAVAAGIHPDTLSAVKAMGNGFEKTYEPQPELVETYAGIYKKYELLGEFVENNINNKG
ncbi:MAG: ribulokinase [Flammeovirgaceae bacterium]|nr:ribulokinase [Flammeovirgaceae bacterium]MBE61631.1 ribulokinase [Flammeovirgaceae bacterium]MBR07475.1 ribulokinase [Rickettsiales bacterium]HCX24758.1 ribulokinase [Cytophagales bacterium]|tara:strand:+ start:5363 stop:7024 length:1662 start_codon:yes stop_codon:yes gene_type:complete